MILVQCGHYLGPARLSFVVLLGCAALHVGAAGFANRLLGASASHANAPEMQALREQALQEQAPGQQVPGEQAPGEQAPAAAGQPRARLEVASHDWGALLKGESTRFTYRIHNEGNGPLRITSVRPSCGCATERYTRGAIAPGEIAEVELVIDTRRLPRGRQSKTAMIYTTDPDHATIEVTIEGDVQTVFRTEPAEIRMSGLAAEDKSASFLLVPDADLSYELLEVAPRMRHVTVNATEVVVPSQRYRIEVQATPSLPGLRQEELHVSVRTPDGVTHTEVVPIIIESLERILVEPSVRLILRREDTAVLRQDPPLPVRRELVVRSARPELRFQILGMSFLGEHMDAFSASFTTIEDGQRYAVSVTLERPLEVRFTQARLLIKTDDPDCPVREVAIVAQFDPNPKK